MDDDSGESECSRDGCIQFRNNLKHLMASTKRHSEDLQNYSRLKQEYELVKHQLVSHEDLVQQISKKVEEAINGKEIAEAELKQMKSAAEFDRKRAEIMQREADDAEMHKQSAIKWREKYDSVCELAEKLDGNNQKVKEKFEAAVKTLEAAGRRIANLEGQLNGYKEKERNGTMEANLNSNKYLKSAISLIDALSSTANLAKQSKQTKDLLNVFRRDDVRLFFGSEPWKNSSSAGAAQIAPDGTLSEEEALDDQEDEEEDEDVLRLEKMMMETLTDAVKTKKPIEKPDFVGKMREFRTKTTRQRMVPASLAPAPTRKPSSRGLLDPKLVHSKHVPTSDFDLLAKASEARKKALLGESGNSEPPKNTSGTIHGRKGKTVREQQMEMMSSKETVREKAARMRAEAGGGTAAPQPIRSQSIRVRDVIPATTSSSQSSESTIRRSSRISGAESEFVELPAVRSRSRSRSVSSRKSEKSRPVSRKSSPVRPRSRSASRRSEKTPERNARQKTPVVPPVTPSRDQRALIREQKKVERIVEKIEKKRPAPKPQDSGPPTRVTGVTSFVAPKRKLVAEKVAPPAAEKSVRRSTRNAPKASESAEKVPEVAETETSDELEELQIDEENSGGLEDVEEVPEDSRRVEALLKGPEDSGSLEKVQEDVTTSEEVPASDDVSKVPEDSTTLTKLQKVAEEDAPEDSSTSTELQKVPEDVQKKPEDSGSAGDAPEEVTTPEEVQKVPEGSTTSKDAPEEVPAPEDLQKKPDESTTSKDAPEDVPVPESTLEVPEDVQKLLEDSPTSDEDPDDLEALQIDEDGVEDVQKIPEDSRPSKDAPEEVTTPEDLQKIPEVPSTSSSTSKVPEHSRPPKSISKAPEDVKKVIEVSRTSKNAPEDVPTPKIVQKLPEHSSTSKSASSSSRQQRLCDLGLEISDSENEEDDDLALDILAGARMPNKKVAPEVKKVQKSGEKVEKSTSEVKNAPKTAEKVGKSEESTSKSTSGVKKVGKSTSDAPKVVKSTSKSTPKSTTITNTTRKRKATMSSEESPDDVTNDATSSGAPGAKKGAILIEPKRRGRPPKGPPLAPIGVKEVGQKKMEKTTAVLKSHLRQAFDLKLPITEVTRPLEEKGIHLTNDVIPLAPEDAVDVMMHFLSESPSGDMWAVLGRQRTNGVVELVNKEEENFLQVAVSLNSDDQQVLGVFLRRIVADISVRSWIDSKQVGRLSRLFCHAIRFSSILEASEKRTWMRKFLEVLLLKHSGHFAKCLAYCLVSDAFEFLDWLPEQLEQGPTCDATSLAIRILTSSDSDEKNVVNWLLDARFQQFGVSISKPAPETVGATFLAAVQIFLDSGDLRPLTVLARTGDAECLHVAFRRLETQMKRIEAHFGGGDVLSASGNSDEQKEKKHKSVFAMTSSSSSSSATSPPRKLTAADAAALRKEFRWQHAVLLLLASSSPRPIMEALRKISVQLVAIRDVILVDDSEEGAEDLRAAIDELAELAGEFTNYPLKTTVL